MFNRQTASQNTLCLHSLHFFSISPLSSLLNISHHSLLHAGKTSSDNTRRSRAAKVRSSPPLNTSGYFPENRNCFDNFFCLLKKSLFPQSPAESWASRLADRPKANTEVSVRSRIILGLRSDATSNDGVTKKSERKVEGALFPPGSRGSSPPRVTKGGGI